MSDQEDKSRKKMGPTSEAQASCITVSPATALLTSGNAAVEVPSVEMAAQMVKVPGADSVVTTLESPALHTGVAPIGGGSEAQLYNTTLVKPTNNSFISNSATASGVPVGIGSGVDNSVRMVIPDSSSHGGAVATDASVVGAVNIGPATVNPSIVPQKSPLGSPSVTRRPSLSNASSMPGVGSPLASPLSSTSFKSKTGMIQPPPPPPENESKDIRLTRQQRELKEALTVLHSETVYLDSDCKVFAVPVDPRLVPGYSEVVKRPMDLSTIGKNLRKNTYKTIWPYLDDMHLMIDNCMLFNKQGSFFHKHAQKILKFWQPRAEHIAVVTLASHNYCCGKRRVLSGESYRCRGGTCFIKYGSVYWYYDPQDDEDPIVYCQAHYQRLQPEVTIPRFGNGTGDDITFDKDLLERRRHTSPLTMEKLLTCERCGSIHHEICSLHLASADSTYQCPRCRRATGKQDPDVQSPRLLPECSLSKTIEAELAHRVPLVGKCICVRVVDSEREMCEVKKLLKTRHPELESGYPYSRKMILFFLDIDGRPVCFFGMIIHEYGSDCSEPNKNRAYLALLDSVKLPKTMLPSPYRTVIYHSSIRGYLRSAGERGYQYCHIYTCPPRKGQNYIFPFKPEDQKEISVVRLRKWYADIMTASMRCKPPAIVGFQNIGEVYRKPTLKSLPYFDGDNWPDMIEDILKVDQTQADAEKLTEELKQRVDDMEAMVRQSGKDLNIVPENKKPGVIAGYYIGIVPPKKRRKVEQRRAAKPKMTADDRLYRVMSERKRDFLVVKLINSENSSGTVSDPDAGLKLATISGDNSVSSFMKREKLEFSSLRHAKFSTMLLLSALLSEKPPAPRFPCKREQLNDKSGLSEERADISHEEIATLPQPKTEVATALE